LRRRERLGILLGKKIGVPRGVLVAGGGGRSQNEVGIGFGEWSFAKRSIGGA